MVYMLYMCLATAVGKKEKYVCIPTREMNAHNVLTQQKIYRKRKKEQQQHRKITRYLLIHLRTRIK